eukprot:COSAG01_NODE_2097_length_8434_cov_116.410678_3_plen_1492_part_00
MSLSLSREELGGLKPRALKQRAREVGVAPEQLEEVDDADDVKAAIIDLIMAVVQQTPGDLVEARLTSLRTELEAQKPSALKKRAREVGVDPERLDEADDADDVKGAVVALILEKERQLAEEEARAAAVQALLAELTPLKPRALKKRALASGVDPESVDEADDADDVKGRLIELIMGRELSPGASSLPEGVPPEPEGAGVVNVHSAGRAVAAIVPEPEPESEGEEEGEREGGLGRPPPAKRAPPRRPAGSLPSSHRAFGSMRFDGVVPAHAEQLQAAMRGEGAELEIVNMAGGGDIDRAVQDGILAADAFVVFGSAKYGEDTGNAACTYYESKFAQGQKKKIILIRMIPFEEEFVFPQAKFMFGINMLELPWMLGTPMPADLPHQVLKAMGIGAACAPPSSPAPPSAPQPGIATMDASQMAGKVLDRREDYSDRRQLRQDITKWAMDTSSGEPGCLLIGGPGAGKTTLLTELVEDATAEFHATVLATHFCAAHDLESLKPQAFVCGIATQLYTGCRRYREYVDTTAAVQEKVKKLLSGDFDGEPTSSFIDLLMRPLKAVFSGSARPTEGGFVLCIDSLDEALLVADAAEGQAGQSSTIVQLLKTCSSKRLFPPWLKVVATSRDVPEVAQLKSWRRIDLGSETRLEENRATIRAYINIRLDATDSPLKAHVDQMVEAEQQPEPEASEPEPEGTEQPEAFHCHAAAHPYFRALVERSGGNFLYAATALNDVEAGMGDLADVGSLPNGLDELFLHFFERLFEGADGEKYTRVRPVFEAIAASEAGVAEADLLKCMRVCEPAVEERVLKAALQGVRQFLKGATQSGTKQRLLVCYHLSFAAWLEAADHEYAITVEHGHRSLAIVQLVALARELTPALADELARACVEELECDGGLTGKLLRKMRPQGGAAAGAGTLGGEALYGLARHLALAIEAVAADMAVFGALLRRAVGDVDARSAVRQESLEGVSLEAFLKRCGRETLFPMASARGLTAAAMRDVTAEEVRAMIEGAGYTVSSGVLANVLVDLRPRQGKRALELALETSHAPALVPLLLHAGASSTATDAKGRTALHAAAANGHVEALRCLLSAEVGAALEAKGQDGRTALHMAAQNGRVEALRYLLSAEVGAELEAKDQDGSTALHKAAFHGHVEALRYLLSAEVGAEVEAKYQDGSTALHRAARNGHVEALRYLLSAEVGAEVEAKDQDGNTALHLAAFNGHVEALRYLLSAEVGAELEAKTQDGRTALHLAAFKGQVEALRYLLSAEVGAALEAKGQYGRTALHEAAFNGHVEALRYLLSAEVGAELEAQDQYGRTALHAAAGNGHAEALRCLLSAEVGAEVEAKNQFGWTALHLAAFNGHVEALRYLLSAEVGAELEAQDQYGRTALHAAARKGHIEVLGALLELGATVDLDGDGGAQLLSSAGARCEGEDAAERKAATVAALRELGVGDGSGTGGGDGRGEQSLEVELEPEPEPEAKAEAEAEQEPEAELRLEPGKTS